MSSGTLEQGTRGLRHLVGHRYLLVQAHLGKELVSRPDYRGQGQLVPPCPAATICQPCRPLWPHVTLDTRRSRGQGQEPLWVVRFARGPQDASFSSMDP